MLHRDRARLQPPTAEAALSCLQEARLAGAWLEGVSAADLGVLPAEAGAGVFWRAEQLKPLLSSGVSASPCSEIPAEQEKPLGNEAQRGETRGSNLYPAPAKAADRDNRAKLLPEPPLSCLTLLGCCRAGIPIPHPESEEGGNPSQ